METEIMTPKKEKEFDAVQTFREIKESISKDIWGLSYDELKKYLERSKHEFVHV